jgi:ribosomal protein S18 acetylase RimI-like enzyme
MSRRTQIAEAVADHIDTHLVRGRAHRTPDVTWYATDAPTSELNDVPWLSGLAGSEVVRDLLEQFGSTPFLWSAWPELNGGRDEEAFLACGLEFREEEPLMALQRLDDLPDLDTSAVIDVTGTARVQDWLRLWIGRPDLPDMPDMAAALALAGSSTRYLLLEADGVPVSVAAAVVAGKVGAVEHVVTQHDKRGRGFGTVVTVAALRHARAMGAARATLTASPEGFDIYRRLGFERVTTTRRYTGAASVTP